MKAQSEVFLERPVGRRKLQATQSGHEGLGWHTMDYSESQIRGVRSHDPIHGHGEVGWAPYRLPTPINT